eukprot:13683679-Alexandrium_andersonii.AAC.1
MLQPPDAGPAANAVCRAAVCAPPQPGFDSEMPGDRASPMTAVAALATHAPQGHSSPRRAPSGHAANE